MRKIILLFFIIIFCIFVFRPVTGQVANYTLNFSTYIGGSAGDQIRDTAIDSQGNIYIAGGTDSDNFPTTAGAYRRTHDRTGTQKGAFGYMDAFVSKFSPSGQLIWSTLIGGPNYDRAYNVEVDNQGYVYVAGRSGPGLPTTAGAFQQTFYGYDMGAGTSYGYQNAFVAKLRPDGSGLVWMSYFSSGGMIRDLDIDENGDLYAQTGYDPSWSPVRPDLQWPAWFANSYRKTPYGGTDIILAKIKSDGTQVLWATYVGGSGDEGDPAGTQVNLSDHSVYVLEITLSTNAPCTAGAYRNWNAGQHDYYLARFSADGSSLLSGTYIGSSGEDWNNTHNIAIDSQGNFLVTVSTPSTNVNWPTTVGAFQTTHRANTDTAVSKISSDGTQLLASTYIGGNANDNPDGVSVDAQGKIYVTGNTGSTDFPITSGAYQSLNAGLDDGFLTVLSSDLSSLVYSTYIGGSQSDGCRSSAIDSNLNFACGGITPSVNWPVLNAAYPTKPGAASEWDGALAKFTLSTPVPDTQAPTVPGNIVATAVSSSQINLSWTASTDNVGVTGYRIYRCQGAGCTPSTQISTSVASSYSNTGLAANTLYRYTVSAFDAAGNTSGQSAIVQATTLAGGATTVRFYAGAGDGNVWKTGSSWDTTHDAADGTYVSYSLSTDKIFAQSSESSGSYEIIRGFIPIDTSGLPDNAVISAATLYLYSDHIENTDNDGYDFVVAVRTSQSSPSSLMLADFDQCGSINSPQEGSNRADISSMIQGAYNSLVLNSTGLGWISKTGYTFLGIREGHDVLDSSISASTRNRMRNLPSETSGNSQDPYLEVTYTTGTDTTPPSAPTGVTVN